MNVSLRPARAEDAPVLADLLRQLGYADAGAFIGQRLAGLLEHPDALLHVAEAQGTVLGFISLHFIAQIALAGDFCRISYLCVDARARGAGIGARLEEFAQAQARLRGCDRIELHSHSRRVDAHRFYARQGYSESPKYLVKKLAA